MFSKFVQLIISIHLTYVFGSGSGQDIRIRIKVIIKVKANNLSSNFNEKENIFCSSKVFLDVYGFSTGWIYK